MDSYSYNKKLKISKPSRYGKDKNSESINISNPQFFKMIQEKKKTTKSELMRINDIVNSTMK